MLRLPGGLKYATGLKWLTCQTLAGARKPFRLAQLRSTDLSMQTALDDTNRSFSASSFLADSTSLDAYRDVGMIDDALTRSQSGCSCEKLNDTPDPLDVQSIVAALPEIAHVPAKKRTFHITHEDLEARVRPLMLCHWHVGRVGNSLESSNQDLRVFSLNKLFSFKTFRAAVEFFDALAGIQDEERHHARVTVDYANVYVSVHTHVAYQPSSTLDAAVSIKVPGLTIRDIRFAVKVERLHETFLGDGRAVTKIPVDSAGLQTWSMEQLKRRYPPSNQDKNTLQKDNT